MFDSRRLFEILLRYLREREKEHHGNGGLEPVETPAETGGTRLGWNRRKFKPRKLSGKSNDVVFYRVTMQVSDLGWVDNVLRLPLAGGPLPLATYCPNRMRGHAKSESTQPRSETCLVTL